MINVVGLALYGPLAASTRYRLGQYVPGLRQYGVNLQVKDLLGDEYLRRRFSAQGTPWTALASSALARLRVLRETGVWDAAILYAELFPLMPGWIERGLLPWPYIYDFDDAFYLKYRTGRLAVTAPLLGDKVATLVAGAAAVTSGNETLAAYARVRNQNTHLLPTVVDTIRYTPSTRGQNAVFTVGWIGSPSTAPYLAELVGPLEQLALDTAVKLVVIGGKAPLVPGVSVEEVEWNEQTEVALINGFDVGVMPLPDDDWARGKCAFKLIQYMACGVPVVASRVGANVDVVQPDCGILASTPDEWLAALRRLRDSAATRGQMGEAGRARVDEHYSLSKNLPILADVIRQVGGGASGSWKWRPTTPCPPRATGRAS
mgnify:CR=1 FL=1